MKTITFSGIVIKGKQKGKSLGFPTANISLHQKIPMGIYISTTNYDGSTYPSISYIGNEKTLETYILDFDADLYGKWITVELRNQLRNSQKFDSTPELIDIIKEDEKKAREYFKIPNSKLQI